jgi:predicted RNase H-like HicB family nuclease
MVRVITVAPAQISRLPDGRQRWGPWQHSGYNENMRNEFTAVIEQDEEWFVAYCPEIPEANGQGKTHEEALASLSDAIRLVLEDRREEGLRGVPTDAIRQTVVIG